jgi:hypothetical protein
MGLLVGRRLSCSQGAGKEGRSMMAAHSVECVDTDGAETRAAPWRDLCSRAIEGNVFAEPGFLIPAARHLGPRALQFLMV